MVTLDVVREEMRKRLERDKELHSVEVHADTLEEALSDAATQLNCRVVHLEYEVLEPGFAGIMGLMKKPWFIRAYQNAEEAKKAAIKSSLSGGSEDSVLEEEKPVDKDGVFYVHYFSAQINLKVLLPVGKGIPVQLSEVMGRLKRSDTVFIEEDLVKLYNWA